MEAIYPLLEKLGYTHPIHAPMTHVPIGLVVGALVFTLIARTTANGSYLTSARHCTALALVSTIPTILLGYADWQHYYAGVWMPQIERKMLLAALLAVSLTATWVVLKNERRFRRARTLLVVLNVLLVSGLGYFGGDLMFNPLTPKRGVDSLTDQKGAEHFKQLCASCHPNGGNALKANLPLRRAPQLESVESFVGYLRNPRARDGSNTLMPAFGEEKLSMEQARDLYRYVHKDLAGAGN